MKRLEHLDISVLVTLALFVVFGMMSCNNTGSNGKGGKEVMKRDTTVSQLQFPFPAIPEMLTSPDDRKDYLLTHYWERFNFADTMLVNNREVTEQGFVNFIALLADSTTSKELVCRSLENWCTQFTAEAHARMVLTSMTDNYLYNPNSPFYNEELYGLYLKTMLTLLPADDVMRSSFDFKLKLVSRNKAGEKASDFIYYLPDGRRRSLSQTPVKGNKLIVIFYDPECESCHRELARMGSDVNLASALKAGRISVLAIYTEGNEEAWRRSLPDMPHGWIVGTDRHEVQEKALYDLKAMPSLYLLDGQKRVILKDATYETVRRTVMQQEP